MGLIKFITGGALIALATGFSAQAACPNLAGVYASESDPLDQQVWQQSDDCSQVSVHTRILSDPLLGTVDLSPVVWVIGAHPAKPPFTFTSTYSWQGSHFIAEVAGANGKDCIERRDYHVNADGNLALHYVYFCDPNNMIIDQASVLLRAQ